MRHLQINILEALFEKKVLHIQRRQLGQIVLAFIMRLKLAARCGGIFIASIVSIGQHMPGDAHARSKFQQRLQAGLRKLNHFYPFRREVVAALTLSLIHISEPTRQVR